METYTPNEFFHQFFPPTLTLFLTAIISVIIGLYLEKFKSRLVFLKYKIIYNSLGTTIQNEFWGNIEVHYGGNKTNHLNFVSIHLINESNTDLENVNVDIMLDFNNQILGHHGIYDESRNVILLEQNYYNYFIDVSQRYQQESEKITLNSDYIIPVQLTNEIKWVLSNKKFNLPVFNRRTSIQIDLLIENFNGEQPEINLSVLHKSVKLINQRDKTEEEKRMGISMIVWGLLIFIVSCIIVGIFNKDSITPIIIIGIFGVLQLFFGLMIYLIIKFIKQYLS